MIGLGLFKSSFMESPVYTCTSSSSPDDEVKPCCNRIVYLLNEYELFEFPSLQAQLTNSRRALLILAFITTPNRSIDIQPHMHNDMIDRSIATHPHCSLRWRRPSTQQDPIIVKTSNKIVSLAAGCHPKLPNAQISDTTATYGFVSKLFPLVQSNDKCRTIP